eukprot:4895610-Amphidinium_carterae.1
MSPPHPYQTYAALLTPRSLTTPSSKYVLNSHQHPIESVLFKHVRRLVGVLKTLSSGWVPSYDDIIPKPSQSTSTAIC